MHKKWSFISLFLILNILTILGCQATPDNPSVINKEKDMLDTIQDVAFEEYSAPDTIALCEVRSGLNININAEVIIPKTDAYSVYEIEKLSFDESYYKRIMQYFQPNNEWYHEPQLTKADILNRIIDLNEWSTNEGVNRQEEIDELKAMLVTAPDEANLAPFSFGDIKPNDMFFAYSKEQGGVSFNVLAGHYYGNTYQYRRNTQEYWIPENNIEEEGIKKEVLSVNPSITLDTAQRIADQILVDLDIDPSMQLSYSIKAFSYDNQQVCNAGWFFCYMRDCNGLQSSFVDEWSTWKGSPAPSNAAPWDYEFIQIIIDDLGIARFDMRGAGEQSKVLINNVPLMSFGEIVDRVKNQLVYNHAYQPDIVEEYSVDVHSIKLVSSLVNVANTSDTGRLIPAWEIAYSFYERFNTEPDPMVYDCYIYLNAIDGSYIEPRAAFQQMGIY